MNKKEFQKATEQFFNDWSEKGCKHVIIGMIAEQKILTPEKAVEAGMDCDDAFDRYWDDIEERMMNGLNKVVGGDWYDVGHAVGFDDEQLNFLYVERYQSKTDPFSFYTDMMIEAGGEYCKND